MGVPGDHLNLNKINEDFLEKLYIDKYIEHDKIHDRVKLGNQPAYFDLRKDKTKAMMDKDLFEKADPEVV